jgi:phasin
MQDTSSPMLKTPDFTFVDIPKLEASAAEVTSTMREFAERGIMQAKDAYTKMKTAAEEATGVLDATYANASKGASDYGLKVIEMARVNSNAAFDFTAELISARTLAQVIEISTSHARKQIELATEQAKELASLAQKVVNHAAEPMRGGLTNIVKKAA